jgi:hypothetical protein
MGLVQWILFIGSFVILPGSALLALRWAAKSGHFDQLEKGALLIFDEEEPVGTVTDHFPCSANAKNTHEQ